MERGVEMVGTDVLEAAPDGSTSFINGNLLDPEFVAYLVQSQKPDIIVNTVALPNIDKCENEPELAKKLNVDTAAIIAQAAEKAGSRLLHISTDQLFTGKKPFSTEEDVPQPVNMYAKTKLDAENAILKTIANAVIVRTNFYGWSPAGHGRTFGEWLYEGLKDRQPMNLITDYYFTPIEVTCFVQALKVVALSSFRGIVNIAGTERCSKYDFGMAMAKEFGFQTDNITLLKNKDLPNRVERPKDISLSTDKFSSLFDFELPGIKKGLWTFRKTMPA
jgi:dTDP-4-dehydrorhamnose reductase